jgi:LmbE family N-acetylglucosaminyl deacetylase
MTTDELTPLDVVTRPSQHIFLSPHYDDIALSCGGTARLASRSGSRPLIALIFGSEPDLSQPLSDFAEAMHRGWGLDATAVVAGRRAEEAAASAILGADDRFLPFHDAIYRGTTYTSNEVLFSTPAESEATLPGRIVDELGLGGLATSHARIYAPLAIGNHVDHQLAFEAGRELANAGWDVWFYEDLPYALNPERLQSRLTALDGQIKTAALVDVGIVWDDKISAIMAYPSQLPTIFDYVGVGHSRDAIDGAMSGYAGSTIPGKLVERFWNVV